MKSVLALIAALALCLSATQAFAHAKPKAHDPATGAEVTAPVTQLTLNFSKSVRLMGLTLVPIAADAEFNEETELDQDQAIELTEPFVKKFKKSVSVRFNALDRGHWVYQWRAVAKDGHTMRGSGHFIVVSE